jgi:CheY-like chemotaxis protein
VRGPRMKEVFMTLVPPRILIAEDNRVMSEVMRFNLQRAGFEVEAVSNGRRAWERLQQEPFSILLTDHQMPEMAGDELCRNLRQSTLNQDIPVIMISAKGYELDVEMLHSELRITKVLFKPFSPRQIVESVSQILHAIEA